MLEKEEEEDRRERSSSVGRRGFTAVMGMRCEWRRENWAPRSEELNSLPVLGSSKEDFAIFGHGSVSEDLLVLSTWRDAFILCTGGMSWSAIFGALS
ncbi:hypothetical protein R1flu_011498 [Riccia fluitans]|uniref:Uncharacterized protein n=1 Tax=Riccia fluitans TaxID=41844 RepID=A0ABD1Z7Z4_9MARC